MKSKYTPEWHDCGMGAEHCPVCRKYLKADMEDYDAYARLIAAAPDLLQIVLKLKEYIDAGEDKIYFSSLSDDSDDITLADMVNSAIAKANGR